ncbi:MAG TPA: peptidylprolyl isomerase [bacterium]|nr:peptidylprolyl isomerase [bacterium]
MKRFFGLVVAASVLAVCASAAEELYGDTHVALKYEEEEMPLRLSAEARALPPGTNVAVLELEDGAAVEVQLLEAETPETAANFVRLVEDKFYDGIPFHRVVPDFVVQAGDATLVGRENPDISLEVEADVRECLRGAVSMARLARPDEDTGDVIYGDTSPTQFFILKKDSPHLDDNFCVFGVVVTGMGIVDGIQQGDLIKRIRILTVAEGEAAAVED